MGQFSWQIVRFSLTTFLIWDQVAMLSTNAALEARLLVHAACETSTVLCTGWNRRIGGWEAVGLNLISTSVAIPIVGLQQA